MKKFVTIGLPLATLAAIAVFFLYSYPSSPPVAPVLSGPNQQMKERLSPEAYAVMYEKGTERPFSSPLDFETRKGTYVSADSGLPLFRSEDKYDSGTGWPSFTKPISMDRIVLSEDSSLPGVRTEVSTKDTGAHLGHVFDDGPPPLGKRYCMNGVALRFIPDETGTSTPKREQVPE